MDYQASLNAGTDTSATTTEWALSELMANPDIRKQAQAELDAVVGQERLVQESDIANLPLLQTIVKETYRLHPAAPLAVKRESHEPCVVSGFDIPAHTQLILNVYAIHRDPNEWTDPEAFKPSRFVGHPEVNPLSGHDSYQLIPFGAGRRMCPGYNLGHTMVSIMLATLLHSFDWSLPEGQSAQTVNMAEFNASLINFRLNPLRVVATPRSSAALF
jgi:cytochrome P450